MDTKINKTDKDRRKREIIKEIKNTVLQFLGLTFLLYLFGLLIFSTVKIY